jgi:hypothetical protein
MNAENKKTVDKLKELTKNYEWTEVNCYNWFFEVKLRDEKNDTATYKINAELADQIIHRVEQVIYMFFNK